MFTEFLLLVATLAFVFYIWQRHTYSYWNRMKVKHIKATPILGNFKDVIFGKRPFFVHLQKLYNEPGFENEPVIGVHLLKGPGLIIRDLELIKTIMVKKFNHFSNRFLQTDPHNDPLGYNNLFMARDSDWKELRNKMTPVFTSGKIKQMYPLMVEIGKELEASLSRLPKDAPTKINELCSRFTTDMIATTAFGVRANALSDIKSEFYEANVGMLRPTLHRTLHFLIIFMLPMFSSLARVKFFSKESSDFIRRSISYVLAERERSGVRRNDIIDILLAMRQEAAAQPDKPNKAKDLDFLVAQAAIFQVAGYETSSFTMTLTLYELALNINIQDRLRTEIKEFFGDEDHISYERIQEMPYLTQVVNETLRMYPIVAAVERECTRPSTGERFTLAPFYDMEVPVGMPIYVSLLGIHRDKKYWPEPEKYDPDRFAPENRKNLNLDAYMPFSIGPHNCIGMRLGLLQAKLGLVHLLRNHRVLKCDKTIKTIEFTQFTPGLISKHNIWLDVECS